MPLANAFTSAPTLSHRSAISFIKLILVAKNEFEAYFISSEVLRLVNNIGVSLIKRGLYIAFMIFIASLHSVPTTILSGCLKSFIAAPSLRNSGLDTTENLSLE